MAPNEQLEKYVSQNLAIGVPPSIIAEKLIKNGWREKDILPYLPSLATQSANQKTKSMGRLSKWLAASPELLLRFGLAFVLVYAALFVSDNTKTGAQYIPVFFEASIVTFISLQLFLILFAAVEIILALWLLSGKLLSIAALLTGLLILLITAANLWDFHVLFRNIAIICAAFALAGSSFTKSS